MLPQTVFVILGLALGAVLIWEGIRGRAHSETATAFFLYDGRLSLARFAGTLSATNLSLGNFIYVAAIWAYFYGFSGILWFLICITLVPLVFIIYAKRFPQVKNYVEDRKNSGTIPEFLMLGYSQSVRDRGGVALRVTASVASIVTLLIALLLELHLASILISAILDIPVFSVFVVFAALLCIYAALGGFWTVVVTDLVGQGALVLAVFGGLYLAVSAVSSDLDVATYSSVYPTDLAGILFGVGWANILGITVIGVGWFLVTMDTWQRASASRSLDTSVKGAAIGGGVFVVSVVVFGMFGIFDRLAIAPAFEDSQLHSGGANPILDFFLLGTDTGISGIALGVFTIGFVMAGLSTVDTLLIVCSHSLVSDLLLGAGKRQELGTLSEQENLKYAAVGRGIVVLVGITSVFLWLLFDYFALLSDPLTLFFVAYSIQFALLAPMYYAVRKKRPSISSVLFALGTAMFAGILVGIGGAVAAQKGVPKIGWLSPDQWVVLTPVIISGIGFLVLGLARKTVVMADVDVETGGR